MFPLFLRRIVSLGLVWLGTALPPATAVFAQESKQEHILFQAIRRGDTELLRGAVASGHATGCPSQRRHDAVDGGGFAR